MGEPWLIAIPELELRLDSLKARSRVKAARSLAEVAEGLRIAVPFFPMFIVRLYCSFILGSNQN